MDGAREAGLTLRIITLILAVILIAFGSATIGLIRHNRALVDEVEDATLLDSEEAEADLLLTVFFTMSTASWIIFLAGCVAIGETIALILQLMRGGTIRTVLNVFEVIISFIVAFFFLATGIVCAVLADEWSGPPERCITDDTTDDLDCRDVALTGTNTIQAIICFIQTAVFGITGIVIVYTMTLRKATTSGQNDIKSETE